MTQSMGDRKNQYIVFSSSQCKRWAESILLCLWNKGENSKIYRRDIDKAWESQGSCTDVIETSRIRATRMWEGSEEAKMFWSWRNSGTHVCKKKITGYVWKKVISRETFGGFMDSRTSMWRGGQGQRCPHDRTCFVKSGMVCKDIAEG